ncbi:MAG: GTPase [Phycisphaerales bacterium]|jgi:tRNA modification GTPase
MLDGSTIAAIGTAPGHSARALVRVSGPEAARVGRAVLCEVEDPSASTLAALHSRRACFAASFSLASLDAKAAALPLPVRGIWMRGPHSFTGEDTLELLVPGNPLITRRVMAQILALPGVRHAEPGEFSARAYLNGRLTLEQAEGVAAGIAAQNAAELAAAHDLSSGRTGAAYSVIAEEIATLLALIEAGIDFSDQEDVRAISPEDFARRVRTLLAGLSHMGDGGHVRETEPLVVLAGPPNAGKSTLFNAMLGRERAVAAPVAGTTRDVLIEPLTLTDGARQISVRLADVAGLDEDGEAATSEIARAAAARARDTIAAADLVLHCDSGATRARSASESHQVPPGTNATLAAASGSWTRHLHVRTFADRPAPGHYAAIKVCALDGYGLEALRREIIQRLAGSRSANAAALVPRHAEVLRQTAAALTESLANAHPETIAQSLRLSLDAIGEIAGRITPDDVLGRVFSRFCVGK